MRYTDKKPYVEEMHLSGVNRQRIYKQSFVHDPFFVDFNTLRFDRSADNVTPDKTPFSMLLDIRLSKNRLKIMQTNNKQQQTNKKRQKEKQTDKEKTNRQRKNKQTKKKQTDKEKTNRQRKNKNKNNKKQKQNEPPHPQSNKKIPPSHQSQQT